MSVGSRLIYDLNLTNVTLGEKHMSSGELRFKQKQKRFEDWMAGDHVLVQLDARAEGVEVPIHLADNPALTLKLSYLFQGETTITDEGITTYLRFSGNYNRCIIPWKAIWGMTSDKGEQQIWNEDVPKEVVIQLAKRKITELGKRFFGKGSEQAEASEAPPEAVETPTAQAVKAETDKRPPRKPELKRIK